MFLFPHNDQLSLLTENNRLIASYFQPNLPFSIHPMYEPHCLLSNHFSLFPIPIPLILTLWKSLLL